MKNPRIAIIVLHYKNLADTRACLRSLANSDYADYRVIVVNNDSPEHGKILRAEFADKIELIQNEKNLGFAEGNNVGIRAALADPQIDAILILNNDTGVEPNFLSELVKVEADMIAPRLMQFSDRNKIDNLGIVLMSSGLPFNRLNESQKLFCPSGGAALYSRHLLEMVSLRGSATTEAISPSDATKSEIASLRPASRERLDFARNDRYYFDPAYFAYAEDLDLGWRARLAGFDAQYAKDAIVYHKGSAVTGKLSDFAVYHTYRNLVWTQFKNMSWPLLLWQSPWLFSGWIFIFFLYLLKGRPLLICQAFCSGLLNLPLMARQRKQIQSRRKVSHKKIINAMVTGLFPKNYL